MKVKSNVRKLPKISISSFKTSIQLNTISTIKGGGSGFGSNGCTLEEQEY